MKQRLSVYLDPRLMLQLTHLAKRQRQSKSLVAETALESFLTPDEADRREAAITRRLDQLARQVERLERDLGVTAETLALFIRYWLIVTPSIPDDAQSAAQARGRDHYESFMKLLGRRLASGRSHLREVSNDMTDQPAQPHEPPAKSDGNHPSSSR
jgi:predicted transcriptional regulator